jgi:hypothetical protein
MGSFMSKHSAAAREKKALLGSMPIDNKASALNYDDPGDKKTLPKPAKDASIEEKRAYLKSQGIQTYGGKKEKDNAIAEVRRKQAESGIKPEEGKFKKGSVDPFSGAKF